MTNRMQQASAVGRLLGLAGILGGLVLLLAFVVDIPPALNTVRLILFLAGGVAIAVTTPGRRGVVPRRLAYAAVMPIILASAASGLWLLAAAGRDRPFAGDFGLIGFYTALAVWLSHGWFGAVASRMDIRWRGAALLLAGAAVLAITGMDRLELTSRAHPTIFGPLGLAGVALDAVAWVLLGLATLSAGPVRVRAAAVATNGEAAVPGHAAPVAEVPRP